jgi:uncharacterized delta-60 repeat protein
VSHPMHLRRIFRAPVLSLVVVLAALVAPTAALADGQLDPGFNGTGFHVGTTAEGTVFSNVENRIPMVVQSDGKIVVGGSRGGFMTLVRYNTDGTIDKTFGSNGFATAQFAGTPTSGPGSSGAVALALDGTNIVAAGFGGSQSMVAARFSATGALGGQVVCFAPHLIDYTARAVAVRANGTVVLAGYARDRFVTPAVLYGMRATVTIPATGAGSCGTYQSANGLSLGSSGVTVDGLNNDGTVTDATLGGRFYDAIAALPDNRYAVATTSGPDGTAWVERYTATGNGALDTSFNGSGRVSLPAASLHALAPLGDGSVLAAGESTDAAVAANRQMLVAKIGTTGAFGAFGSGGIARTNVAGGNDSGQAIAVQADGSVLVGGAANLAGKTAFALTRFTPAGARDTTFGTGGQTVTPFGSPAINGYITGMGLTGNLLAVAGRLTDPTSGLDVVAARYFATGAPPPPPPPPAASTLKVDSITSTSAHITGAVNANGTASTWYLEFGTSASFGSKSPEHTVAASTNDVNVSVTLDGLQPGTTYHARFVITNAHGTTPGDDLVFKTLGAGQSGPAAPAGGAAKKGAKRICKVPKVTGKKLNTARRKVIAGGCKVKLVYKKSKRPKGLVLKQSRKPGKKLVFHAVVKLTVAVKHR